MQSSFYEWRIIKYKSVQTLLFMLAYAFKKILHILKEMLDWDCRPFFFNLVSKEHSLCKKEYLVLSVTAEEGCKLHTSHPNDSTSCFYQFNNM